MPLNYNFGQKGITIPRLLSRIYKYGTLEQVYTIEMKDKSKIVINTKKTIGDAWTFIENNCAKARGCNEYFSNLRKNMALVDILKTVNFTVHRLIAKDGYTEEKLPYANSAGSDFALSMYAFLDAKTPGGLAATILHEIAHFAGATTNRDDEHALDAENALVHCNLKQYYNKEAKG